MKYLLLYISILIIGCGVSKNPQRQEVRKLQRGIIVDDTSYIYSLPFEEGKAYWLVQGYFSRFSHKERVALDFKMKCGTKVYAAREGIVVRVKEDGKRGGLNRKYRADGNNIVIQHSDGSRAGYWHLQKDGALVNVGDSVKKGQVIGLSGKTGYSAFPHLHFLVWDFDKDGKWRQIPTRFETTKGVKYLCSIKRYKRPHAKVQ